MAKQKKSKKKAGIVHLNIMQANRKARRGAEIYGVTPIFRDPKNELCEGQEYQILGPIKDRIIISMPASTPGPIRELIGKKVEDLMKKEVLVITHNIQFLEVQKLSSSESAKLLKEVRDGAERAAKMPSAESGKETGGGSDSCGCGSGVCEHGDSGSIAKT